MKIAIICNETKPVPAVEGGAVETLVDLLINNNESSKIVELDIFSISNATAYNVSKNINNTNFYYIDHSPLIDKLFKVVNKFLKLFNIPWVYQSYLLKLLKVIKNKEYDWIIVENRPLYMRHLYKNKAKIALHLHNDTLSKDNYYSSKVVQYCDRVLSISNYINNRVNNIDNAQGKSEVFINRLDINKFNSKGDINFVREELNLSNKDTLVMYHGRVIEDKGVLELIQAFSGALNTNPNLKLIIIGGTADGEYEKKLLNETSKLPKGAVIMMGYVKHEKLPLYIEASDIIVLPSLWNEPFGLTIIESMAMKKPVISTNVGAIPEILTEECGILVNNDKNIVANLTSEILNLAKNKELQKDLANNARKKVVELYNAENYLQDLVRILKS